MCSKNKEDIIWLLLDDRAGNCSQVLGIGKALKLKYVEKKIRYNQWSKLPNIFLQNNIKHIIKYDREKFTAPWPKVVIGCGRKSAPIGLWIKKKSNNYSKYIQLMWPSYPYRKVDIIFTPLHDNLKNKDNVINIETSPNTIDNELLNKSLIKWKNKLEPLKKPRVALIIGGNTKKYELKPFHINLLFKKINSILNNKGSIMVTTSRRTSSKCILEIKKEIKKLKIKCYSWNVHDESTNPYFGFLAYSDLTIVTGDSMSICSEVCATGKPLLIYAPKSITLKKHALFHKMLIKKGVAKYLENFTLQDLNNSSYKPFNESKNIAKIIKNKYLL